MSGVEIVGAVGSAATLIEVSLKVCSTIRTFIANAKDNPRELKQLHDRILQVHDTTQQIRSILGLTAQDEISSEEAELCNELKVSIKHCREQLELFHSQIEDLPRESRNFIGKARVEWTMNARRPIIAKIERTIERNLILMQMSLQCLQAMRDFQHQQQNNRNHSELNEQMQLNHEQSDQNHHRLSEQIQVGYEQHQKLLAAVVFAIHNALGQLDKEKRIEDAPLAPDQVPDWTASSISNTFDEQNIARVVTAARKVQQKLSSYHPSAASIAEQLNETRSAPSISEDAESIIQDANSPPSISTYLLPTTDPSLTDVSTTNPEHYEETKDVMPDIPTVTHREILQLLANRLKNQASRDLGSGHYKQAETHLKDSITCFEELHEWYNIPFNAIVELQNILAKIYFVQNRNRERAEIRHAIMQEKFVPPPLKREEESIDEFNADRKEVLAQQFYELASENYERAHTMDGCKPFLDAAERDAKRAFRIRRSFADMDNESFLDTVRLIVRIYKSQHKNVHADTYRQKYLHGRESIAEPLTISETVPNTPSSSEHRRSGSTYQQSDDMSSMEILAAIRAHRNENLEELLQQVDISELIDGRSLMKHAIDCKNSYVIDELLRKGEDRNTAFFHAVSESNEEMAEWLLKHDAGINHMDTNAGLTPLIKAVDNNSLKMVRFLMDRGANADEKSMKEGSALHHAVWGHNKAVLVEILRLGRQKPHSIDINMPGPSGRTPLHESVLSENENLTDILLKNGADTEVEDGADLRRTPLILAIQIRQFYIAKLLVDNNAIVDPKRIKPLMKNTQSDIRKLLEWHMKTRSSSTTSSEMQRTDSKVDSLASKKTGRFSFRRNT